VGKSVGGPTELWNSSINQHLFISRRELEGMGRIGKEQNVRKKVRKREENAKEMAKNRKQRLT